MRVEVGGRMSSTPRALGPQPTVSSAHTRILLLLSVAVVGGAGGASGCPPTTEHKGDKCRLVDAVTADAGSMTDRKPDDTQDGGAPSAAGQGGKQSPGGRGGAAGQGGKPSPAGHGGAAGGATAGESAPPTLPMVDPDQCSSEGATRCASGGQAKRQRCSG